MNFLEKLLFPNITKELNKKQNKPIPLTEEETLKYDIHFYKSIPPEASAAQYGVLWNMEKRWGKDKWNEALIKTWGIK